MEDLDNKLYVSNMAYWSSGNGVKIDEILTISEDIPAGEYISSFTVKITY